MLEHIIGHGHSLSNNGIPISLELLYSCFNTAQLYSQFIASYSQTLVPHVAVDPRRSGSACSPCPASLGMDVITLALLGALTAGSLLHILSCGVTPNPCTLILSNGSVQDEWLAARALNTSGTNARFILSVAVKHVSDDLKELSGHLITGVLRCIKKMEPFRSSLQALDHERLFSTLSSVLATVALAVSAANSGLPETLNLSQIFVELVNLKGLVSSDVMLLAPLHYLRLLDKYFEAHLSLALKADGLLGTVELKPESTELNVAVNIYFLHCLSITHWAPQLIYSHIRYQEQHASAVDTPFKTLFKYVTGIRSAALSVAARLMQLLSDSSSYSRMILICQGLQRLQETLTLCVMILIPSDTVLIAPPRCCEDWRGRCTATRVDVSASLERGSHCRFCTFSAGWQ